MKYADVSEELANRILNKLNEFISYEQFCELLKTKEVTYTRISRALLHILLDIKNEDLNEIEYARVLGFRIADSEVLSQIKKQASIPLVTKLAAIDSLVMDTLSEKAISMLKQDIYASDLYESIVTDKFGTPFINEFEQQIVRL